MIYSYGYSIVGSSHEDKGDKCQDANKIIKLENGIVIAAVADGVGSCKYSDVAATIAVNTSLSPTLIVEVILFKDTPVTGIICDDTVTVHISTKPPSIVVTVIIAVPSDIAVTTPLDTVAILGVSLLHVTF